MRGLRWSNAHTMVFWLSVILAFFFLTATPLYTVDKKTLLSVDSLAQCCVCTTQPLCITTRNRGIRTPVSSVTGRDTIHYTTDDMAVNIVWIQRIYFTNSVIGEAHIRIMLLAMSKSFVPTVKMTVILSEFFSLCFMHRAFWYNYKTQTTKGTIL